LLIRARVALALLIRARVALALLIRARVALAPGLPSSRALPGSILGRPGPRAIGLHLLLSLPLLGTDGAQLGGRLIRRIPGLLHLVAELLLDLAEFAIQGERALMLLLLLRGR